MALPLVRAALLTTLVAGAALGATNKELLSRALLPPAPGVTALWLTDAASVPLNSPGIIERSLCLTVGLTKKAAYQCGDLAIAYELPYVRVLGKKQAPALVYNSQLSHPHPLITLDVATPAGTTVPDSIRYVVKVNGHPRDSLSLDDSVLTTNAAGRRRIQVGWDANSDATDAYIASVEAIPFYSNAAFASVSTPNIEMIVVNRANSPIGSGWWIGGVEKLSIPSDTSANRLWVGADGSARIYRYRGTANVWTADSLAGPDTIKFDGTNYTRFASGAKVVFNSSGQHIQTIDARGFTTTFAYSSSGSNAWLKTIQLPKLDSAYRFVYDTTTSAPDTTLDKVLSPGVSANRVTDVKTFGPILWQILDPIGKDESYWFEDTDLANWGRINYRRERAGATSAYFYDKQGIVWKDSVDMGTRSDVTKICPFFSLTISNAACGRRVSEVANAMVNVNGPRPNSTYDDTSSFRLGRYGAPSWIRNSAGDTTTIERTNAQFPAFVTRVRTPDGTVETSTPDGRGNVATMTVANALGDGFSRTTSYTWDSRFDAVTQVTQPLGDYVRMSYNTDGNLEWREDGRGSTSRTVFLYGGVSGNPDYKLLYQVKPPSTRGGAVDSDYLTYDARGNPSGSYQLTDSTGGLFRYNAATHYVGDAIGRQIQTCVDMDSVAKNPAFGPPPQQCTYVAPDLMGRDSVTTTYAVTYNSIPAQMTVVTKIFGNEDDMVIMARESSSAPSTTYRYHYVRDRAGNMLTDSLEGSPGIRFTYDAAGNVLTRTNRRGQTVTMTYDGMNRLRTRAVPAITEASRQPTLTIGDRTGVSYPWTTAGGGYVIPAETTVMDYDEMGRLKKATNNNTEINRTYYPNGLLRKDSLRVKGLGSGVYQAYGIENRYDGNSRRSSLRLPAALVSGSATDSITYRYIAATNELSQVSDPNGQQWSYAYTLTGQVSQLTNPGQRQQNLTYAALGGIEKDELLYTGSPNQTLRQTTSTYDPRGKRIAIADGTGFQETGTFKYSGMGHVVYSHQRSASASDGTHASLEAPTYDAWGNIASMSRFDTLYKAGGGVSTPGFFGAGNYSYNNSQRLTGISASGSTPGFLYSYDNDGNNVLYQLLPLHIDDFREDRVSFYNPEDRLVAADYRSGIIGLGGGAKLVFEQYRYDALGRRVWVRTDKKCDNSVYGDSSVFCDMSTLRRTFWDGDAELMEIQVPVKQAGALVELADTLIDNDSYLPRLTRAFGAKDPNPYFGRVLYIHGLQTDQPIGMVRYNYTDFDNPATTYLTFTPTTVSLMWDTKGTLTKVACSTGPELCSATRASAPSTPVYMAMGLPAYAFSYQRPKFIRGAFQGTLTLDKEDEARTFYRRNRYYDPTSGRFTQEDPIRFAGGASLYGLADGDAVNGSDPFGLCSDGSQEECSVAKRLYDRARNKLREIVFRVGDAGNELKAGLSAAAARASVYTKGNLRPFAGEAEVDLSGRASARISQEIGTEIVGAAVGFRVDLMEAPVGSRQISGNIGAGAAVTLGVAVGNGFAITSLGLEIGRGTNTFNLPRHSTISTPIPGVRACAGNRNCR